MEKLTIQVTVDEANVILAALGQQPYLKVADLIHKIQGQGAAQLENGVTGQAAHNGTIANEITAKHGN